MQRIMDLHFSEHLQFFPVLCIKTIAARIPTPTSKSIIVLLFMIQFLQIFELIWLLKFLQILYLIDLMSNK